jgi:hypothetical protein
MLAAHRQSFNASWSAEKYRGFLDALDRRVGSRVAFRVCETPCFFPQALVDTCARAGAELLEQLLSDPAYRRASDLTIPAEFNVPREAPRPLFAAVDFGLVHTAGGELEPRLVEIQGFPSLYCFQVALAQQFVESFRLDAGLRIIADGASLEEYQATLRRALLGGHPAEHVVLLEIDPHEQKTLPDFLLTERLCGVRAVNIRHVLKHGRTLLYLRDGRRTAIRRIYNRAIVDELVRKKVQLPFGFTDDLDVEWAGHPNWFFRISKFSLPYLQHPCVPQTWFLDAFSFGRSDSACIPSDPASLKPEISHRPSQTPGTPSALTALALPHNLENYVLKPLYSFAGLGVRVGPTRADLDAIPPAQRHNYILQRRMPFVPVVETPHGPTQAEIRVLYIDRSALHDLHPPARGEAHGSPVASHPPLRNWALGPLIIRMGRGKMMGVDHNRDLQWVGASAGLIV